MIVTVIWEGHQTGHKYRVSQVQGGCSPAGAEEFKRQWDVVNAALNTVLEGAHQAEDVIEVLEKAWLIERIEKDGECYLEVELS